MKKKHNEIVSDVNSINYGECMLKDKVNIFYKWEYNLLKDLFCKIENTMHLIRISYLNKQNICKSPHIPPFIIQEFIINFSYLVNRGFNF